MTQKIQLPLTIIAINLVLFFGCQNERQFEKNSFEKLSVYQAIQKIDSIEDTATKRLKLEEFWDGIKDTASIPYVINDTAIFFYRGEANKVQWNGDFNSWGGNKSFDNLGLHLDSTDLWYLVKKFPNDARLDYKITLNNSNWILDPNNPHQQWSGFGPNSELRMPNWEEEQIGQKRNSTEATIDSFTLASSSVNYTVGIKVWLPENKLEQEALSVLYVTDGQEYGDSQLGNLLTITENLIADGKIEPIMIVLLDPRNPNNLQQNRRETEYTINPQYLDFVTEELIPHLKESYHINESKQAILGTSLGGLNASYFGAKRPDIFNYVAIQSPAYWYRPEIFNYVKEYTSENQTIFMSAGTFNDGLQKAEEMQTIYKQKGYSIKFMEVNEGHSWGAWTQQLDDLLIYFFGK